MRRILAPALIAVFAVGLLVSPASATIHPIVESFDCANAQAFAHHPLGDVADPPGQTPGATPGQGAFAALDAVTDGFTDFSSPALFGHKLDGQCGNAP
ncbi:MAG: hypothetical protein L0206_23415 [Actinobacteria bacterium]|nr:hypothetical protein [Actinomycetota bacterium]